MPVTEGINLAMMLAESGMIENAVNELMTRPQLMMAAEASPGMKSAMKLQIQKWRGYVQHRIAKVDVADRFSQELALYQKVRQWSSETFIDNAEQVVKELEETSGFYFKARKLLEHEQKKHNPMFHSYFCHQWYEHLQEALKAAQQNELEHHKDELLKDLYQRIETMQQMEKVDEAGDEKRAGRLWDMAKAKLTRTDVERLKSITKFLQKSSELQEIADSLGRMANEVDDPNQARVQSEELKMVEEKSDSVTDDIVGVHPSDDLARLLPNEAMFLAYPELEVVFYKHLVDKRLMNYRMQGAQRKLRKVKAYKTQSKQVEQDKGPFIVCIDASGSMSGYPEQCAKALAYGLMQIALADERDCYVMLFSTQHITYELTKQDGLSEALNFLSYSFHGGTDLSPVLEQSIELMGSEKYKNADLIVLSDFIAPSQSPDMLENIARLKAHKNRFHAVCLSRYGNPALMEMFDTHWSHHPSAFERLFSRQAS
ncbi:ATPase RavA stimulator ViaA [Photobacterium galatheae]|uniref:Protein viaA n=1 Tax=Photobacterium galatheae TaxID=1654360 RepID=A0A066RQF8_9GAMM|nr:ATPase RavA stimulator ViaA [Photobacterium galatheae]KDM89927.1 protein viaA [Photobacterium galatheae]MCM0149764.1 ATPase RavA stimulator ViaA [Photobacterium galatheae]